MATRPLVEPRTLKGFNDLKPEDALLKRRMTSTLVSVFESFGFCAIETPHLEYTEVLIGDASEEIQKQLFRFTDQGERDVTLRFDLTVPLARYVSQYKNELGLPFKRYAIGSVFRGEKPQKGRYREFTQCDFDFLGTTSLGADAEIVQVIAAGMTALRTPPFIIRINNRHVMNGLCGWLNITDKTAEVIQVVDKIDKIGADKVLAELSGPVGLTSEQAKAILDFVQLTAGSVGGQVINANFNHPAMAHEEFNRGLSELRDLVVRLSASGLSEERYKVDFSIARGLGYYTGTVFETNLLGLAEYGSVCSGGRYDNLTQTFQKEQISGIGASFGLDRLMAALSEHGAASAVRSPAHALVIVAGEQAATRATEVASYLRVTGGLNIDLFPEPAKLKKQLGYAERQGVNTLVFVRDDGSITVEARDGSFKQTTLLGPELVNAVRTIAAR